MPKKRTSLENLFSTQQETPTVQSSSPIPSEKINEKKKQLAVYLHPLIYEQLRTLAFEERHKMHDYLIEGLNLVFKNRGLKSIQDLINKNK